MELILELLQFSQDQSANQQKSSHKILCKDSANCIRKSVQMQRIIRNWILNPRHRTRKRVKRLRYNVEFLQSLFPEKEIKRYLKALKPLQETLGHYNDLFVIESLYRPYAKNIPRHGLSSAGSPQNSSICRNRLPSSYKNFLTPSHSRVEINRQNCSSDIFHILSRYCYQLMDRYNYRCAAYAAYHGHQPVQNVVRH